MKIGIYGGTFNPIHNGHIQLAEKAKRQYRLDKVLFLPSGNSYMKNNVLSGHQRYHMVCLALTDKNGLEASDLEIRREGATYSYETMEIFRGIYPKDELFFLLGEDSLRMIELWKEPARMLKQCNLIVATRMPDAANRMYYPAGTGKAAADHQNSHISDGQLPQYIRYIEEKYNTQIYCLEMQDRTSSSRIREAVAGGQEIGGMVPDAVRDYILKEHLYT